jgi:hypothetical protein
MSIFEEEEDPELEEAVLGAVPAAHISAEFLEVAVGGCSGVTLALQGERLLVRRGAALTSVLLPKTVLDVVPLRDLSANGFLLSRGSRQLLFYSQDDEVRG